MLYYDFKDYEGFKERFGMQEHGNGNKSRKNKILLSYIKQHDLLKRAIAGREDALFEINIPDMSTLKVVLKKRLYDKTYPLRNGMDLANWTMWSSQYYLDGQEGLCEDGDTRAVRYINSENGRVFKMKAGKFLHNVMQEVEWGRNLPEPIQRWMEEEFSQDWQTYATGKVPEYELHVDDNFEDIYDGYRCRGSFGSCMTNDGNWTFYRDAVNAKAAYLTDNDSGKIIARCVIFTEVHDETTGEVLRLAERQYSSEGAEVLKRCLVDALINGGHIDGYKKVGAGCHDNHAFVRNNGDSLGCDDLWIDCDLDLGDTVSYQDSFVGYDMCERKAYNYMDGDYDLATTDGRLEGGNWDSWHEEYTDNDVATVYYHGREYTCDEDRLDDFVYVEHGCGSWEWHHQDDVTYCEDIEDYVLSEDANYSDILHEDWYDEDAMHDAEEDYKREHWTYSEYDEEYYEDEDDVTTYTNEDGREVSISWDSLRRLERNGDVVENEDGEYVAAELVTVNE